MNYIDFEGRPVSRKQFIALGLERGELLVKQDCGCVVIQDRTADAYIVYCLMHETVSDLYEALESWEELWNVRPLDSGEDVQQILKRCWTKTEKALVKAKGKGG